MNYEFFFFVLVELYVECGRLIDFEVVLCVVGDRNIVLWNFFIFLYVNKGMEIEVLCLFR